MNVKHLQKQLFLLIIILVNIGNIQPAKANLFTKNIVIKTTATTEQSFENSNMLTMLLIGGVGFALGLKFPIFLLRRGSKTKDKELIEVNQANTIIETQIEISSTKKDTYQYTIYIEKAYKNFGKGDIETALQNFNDAIRSQPNNAQIYSERAYFRKNKLGDKEGAIADYTQAININPDNAIFYFCRSQTYLEMGDRQKSIDDYNTGMGICK